MSFFRNLRSSLTRGRSTSRDTTPVRNSRPGSVISSLRSGSSKRRDSVESRTDSLLNRSDTFILDDPDATPIHSNCSTLEKKSKKSKVLEKFSTFTKRKKTPPTDKVAFEHHPSDNADNTYYKWQAEEGGNSLDYDCQNDPFNFLYEQQSSRKPMQNNTDPLDTNSSAASSPFDSSTYRKSKMPTDLKKQLKILKEPTKHLERHVKEVEGEEEEVEVELHNKKRSTEESKADKYKTVTLNSFRRSFREKFLQQQKEAAHNPAWFVEVEAPTENKSHLTQRDASKENRRDLLVFENENYRPGSRSPIRDLHNRKENRNTTRSPVKRNETFKVERLSRLDQHAAQETQPEENKASIHIEFKNSITPHIPGRMVPVGVAKPMPSQLPYNNNYRKNESLAANDHKPPKGISTTRLNSYSPIRSPWLRIHSPARTNNSKQPSKIGRYQTLVQINTEKPQLSSPVITRNSRLSTRIQLGNSATSNLDKNRNFAIQSPSFGKRYHSSQLLNQSGSKAPPLKQTYFGELPQTGKISQIPSNLSSSTSGLKARQAPTIITTTTNYGSYKYQKPTLFASASSLTTSPASATQTATQTSTRTTPSQSFSNIYSSSNNNLSHPRLYQQQQNQHQPRQQQTRFAVTGQRRSRSPIKIPWR